MSSSSQKKPDPVQYEVWLRVRCTDPCCSTAKGGRNWTFIPARDLPERVLCVVCRRPIPTKDLAKAGAEWERRRRYCGKDSATA